MDCSEILLPIRTLLSPETLRKIAEDSKDVHLPEPSEVRALSCGCHFRKDYITELWDKAHSWGSLSISREVTCPCCAKSWKVLKPPSWDNVQLYGNSHNRYRTFPKWLNFVRMAKDENDEGSEPGSDEDWYSDSSDEEWK